MWEIIKNILTKKACFHEWKLVKEDRIGAPCADCAFYTSDYGIICSHPNKEQRKCKHESGRNKGWNTTEYVEIPKEYVVEYE